MKTSVSLQDFKPYGVNSPVLPRMRLRSLVPIQLNVFGTVLKS